MAFTEKILRLFPRYRELSEEREMLVKKVRSFSQNVGRLKKEKAGHKERADRLSAEVEVLRGEAKADQDDAEPGEELAGVGGHNGGMLSLNADAGQDGARQFIVIGAARGGTSMVAGALHHLGLPMGEGHNDFTYEDPVLRDAFRRKDWGAVEETIAARDAEHGDWAWKWPDSVHRLGEVDGRFPNPHYIVVFRDVLATGLRRQLSSGTGLFWGCQASLVGYAKLVHFCRSCERPMLLVSYEKALGNPGRFAEELAGFAMIEDEEKVAAVEASVTPDNPAYIASARA